MDVNRHGMPGKDVSCWIDTTPDTEYPALKDDISVDAVVLGGGIAGITTAALLRKGGLKVALVESDRIVKGVTGNTTAHTSALQGYFYKGLIESRGEDMARKCAESCQASIDMIERLSRRHGIDCEFGYADEYFFISDRADEPKVMEEMEAQKKAGLYVTFTGRVPLPFDTNGAIRLNGQAYFHPRKYLLGLAKAISDDGCEIFERTRAVGIQEGEPCTVRTDRGAITAKDVVVATHFPFILNGMLFAHMKPYRSYVLGVRADDMPRPHDMFYSSEEPCHYIRTQPLQEGGALLMVGGEDHAVGQKEDTRGAYKALEKYTKDRFKVTSIDYSWSSQDNYPFDRLPFIGRVTHGSRHVYVATGFKGSGMTYGTVSGMLNSDLILGNKNGWEELYDPGRVKITQDVADVLGMGVEVGTMFFGDRITPPASITAIRPGEAGVASCDGRRCAVYRDETGKAYSVSPVCTHMGCYVRWNDAERTWDCPCHGSRFEVDGRMIHGPATRDLDKIEQEAAKEERKEPGGEKGAKAT